MIDDWAMWGFVFGGVSVIVEQVWPKNNWTWTAYLAAAICFTMAAIKSFM